MVGWVNFFAHPTNVRDCWMNFCKWYQINQRRDIDRSQFISVINIVIYIGSLDSRIRGNDSRNMLTLLPRATELKILGLTQRIYIWGIGALRFANTPYRIHA